MKKFIVSTTINPPTDAIKAFGAMEGWELVVAGDRKTPVDYALGRGTYLSPDDQLRLGLRITDVLPWDSISRRNVATMYALREGADVIAFVDDDNVPHGDWATRSWSRLSVNPNVTLNTHVLTGGLCVDPLEHVYDIGGACPKLWHRGFPIQLLETREKTQKLVRYGQGCPVQRGNVVVQAGLWDGDPDVDAICRIAQGPFDLELVFYGLHQGIDVGLKSFAPFNTQNTVVTRDVAKCMALLPNVGRMDDIWASYMVQRAMREHGMAVSYVKPTVTQRRNEHDLTNDLEAEMLGYTETRELLGVLTESETVKRASLVETFRHVAYGVESKGLLSGDQYDDDAKEFYDAWFADIDGLDR